MFEWASKLTEFLPVWMATRWRRMMGVIFLVGWWLQERRTLREIVTYSIELFIVTLYKPTFIYFFD
jgi:hypothetical protein